MSISFEVLLIIACQGLYSTVYCEDAHKCNPSNPKTLKDVKLGEVSGRWFAHWYMKHYSEETFPRILFLDEFNMDYKGSRKVVMSGRVRYKPFYCTYSVVDFIPTGEKSSWKVEHDYLDNALEWRVLDTDKNTYMVNWTCYRFSVANPKLCTDWAVNVMTRNTRKLLPNSTLNHIHESVVNTVCKDRLFSLGGFDNPTKVCKRLEDSEFQIQSP